MLPSTTKDALDADRLPPDYLAIASLVSSVVGIWFLFKPICWMGFFLLITSYLRNAGEEYDTNQALLSFFTCFVGLYLTYTYGK